MRKLIAVLLLLAMVLAGCASGKETEGFTFTDDLGRQVTVKNPQRVAALLGSYADIWFLAGGTVCASSEDAWDDLELPMPEDAVNLVQDTSRDSATALMTANGYVDLLIPRGGAGPPRIWSGSSRWSRRGSRWPILRYWILKIICGCWRSAPGLPARRRTLQNTERM